MFRLKNKIKLSFCGLRKLPTVSLVISRAIFSHFGFFQFSSFVFSQLIKPFIRIVGALVLTISVLLSCDRVELRDEVTKEVVQTGLSDEYLVDAKGGLFNNVKWYHYAMDTHIIWSFFDIYSIKAPHGVYLVQVANYYGLASEAGLIDLKVRKENDPQVYTIAVDARGCGNPYLNLDYNACMADPERNVFSYVDLKNLTTKKMSDADSLKDSGWDIAFKATSTKLNAGTSGPSSVVGALVKRHSLFFTEAGQPSLAKLSDRTEQERAKAFFDTFEVSSPVIYYLPDGIDRVIHESFWYDVTNQGLREAKDNVWWSVKSHKDGEIVDFSFSQIQEIVTTKPAMTEHRGSVEHEKQGSLSLNNLNEGRAAIESQKHILTVMTLDFVVAALSKQLVVEFSTQDKISHFCVNFLTEEFFKCSSVREDWDLKLTIINQFKNESWVRDWRVFSKRGAKGPFKKM